MTAEMKTSNTMSNTMGNFNQDSEQYSMGKFL